MIAGTPASAETLRQLKQQHPAIFAQQGRYLRTVGLIALAIVLYYVFFFLVFGITWPQFINGCQQLGRYFLRMFVWHDFVNWPFMYYFQQIGITIAIVFAGTITASLIALPLSFFAARNVMSTPLLRPISVLVRRLLDVLRGIDMAIWGLIFVRAVGMGPLAGVLAIVMQDVGLLGKLYAEGHEAVDKSPSRGLTAVGATGCRSTATASSPNRSPPSWRSACTRSSPTPALRRCWASSAPAASAWYTRRTCGCGTGTW